LTRILSNKFAYADLDHISRSLSIDIISPINLLCLEQIHRLLIWCKEHQQIQKISLLFLNITQTVVVDYGESIDHRDLEIGLSADLKIASKGSQLDFDYFKNGLIPGAGGICLLEKMLSPTVVKNWLFGNKPVSSHELVRHGFLYEQYKIHERDEYLAPLLTHLSTLPPVQRVQAKRSFWEKWSHIWDHLLDQESQIFKASLTAKDNIEAKKEKPKFCEIRELKTRLTLAPELEQ